MLTTKVRLLQSLSVHCSYVLIVEFLAQYFKGQFQNLFLYVMIINWQKHTRTPKLTSVSKKLRQNAVVITSMFCLSFFETDVIWYTRAQERQDPGTKRLLQQKKTFSVGGFVCQDPGFLGLSIPKNLKSQCARVLVSFSQQTPQQVLRNKNRKVAKQRIVTISC